jgi:hypothetical protein
MQIMKTLTASPRFVIFTDDADWCRRALPATSGIEFRSDSNNEEDFASMLACNAFIISNSTLSWWAAWLSMANIVICPGRTVQGIDWNRMPERWIHIPVEGIPPPAPAFSASQKPIFRQTWWDRNTPERQDDYVRWTGGADAPSRVAMRNRLPEFGIRSLLDCGCGLCVDREEFEQLEPPVRYSGLDASVIFADFAHTQGLDVRFGFAENLPCEDDSFDAVYFRHVLEHLPHYLDAIAEALRVARRLVVVIWYLPPHDGPDRFLFESADDLYQNTYNRSAFEAFVRGLNPSAAMEWQQVSNESILWIKLEPG